MENTLLLSAAAHREGTVSKNNLLVVKSGQYTARHALAKYVVPPEDGSVVYNQYHQKVSLLLFQEYWEQSKKYIGNKGIRRTYQVGNHPTLNISVNIETEHYWHQLFAQHLFIEPFAQPLEQWSLRCIPSLNLSDEHPVFIGINLDHRQVLICGTGYAGEIKKAMFSVMNYLLPDHQVLSLHCSAVISEKETSSLILGLSGTGKTTLSATNGLRLIGDDEHAWCDDGVFNLEGGCYAKTVRLSSSSEPQIYQALRSPAILENVIIGLDGLPDYDDCSITENIRAAYPIEHIHNHWPGIAPHPHDIIFLCCDLFGVIPALSWLTPQQALDYFMIGYTAKVGATEVSLSQVQPVSSPCFGHPFFARNLDIYQRLFANKLKAHNSRVWLVNTGWGEGGYTRGQRISIQKTRKIIHAITHQTINTECFDLHPHLELRSLTYLSSIGKIGFSESWMHSADFQLGCQKLQTLFKQSLSLVQA